MTDATATEVIVALDRAGTPAPLRHHLIGFYVGWRSGVDLSESEAERDEFWTLLSAAGLTFAPLGEAV